MTAEAVLARRPTWSAHRRANGRVRATNTRSGCPTADRLLLEYFAGLELADVAEHDRRADNGPEPHTREQQPVTTRAQVQLVTRHGGQQRPQPTANTMNSADRASTFANRGAWRM
jgi:hypothetical protein